MASVITGFPKVSRSEVLGDMGDTPRRNWRPDQCLAVAMAFVTAVVRTALPF